jgi:hypothetical protein
MFKIFSITILVFLSMNSLWGADAETAAFIRWLKQKYAQGPSVKALADAIQKRKTNRIPQHVPEATPEEVALPAFPPASTIYPSCKREKVGVCLKRRCPSLTLYALKEEEGELREFFGDDWTQVRDLIRSFWEVLLYAVDTEDTRALVTLFQFPLSLGLNYADYPDLWEGWLLRDEKELHRVLRVMLKQEVKKWFFYNNDCTGCIVTPYGGSFYFIYGKIYFRIKKLPLEKRGRYTYIIVLKSLAFNSDDFFNDIGRIRYELKRKGRRDNTGPYPQS